MSILGIIAKIARRMPYTVHKARIFKNNRSLKRIKLHIDDIDDLYIYVINRCIENADNPRWALMADKYAVREEVERIAGPGHLIPLLGHWNEPADIDFDALPSEFILKTNNGCGTNIFIHNKASIDRKSIIQRLNKSFKFPYPELSGQLHYAKIAPCVIAEDILLQDGGKKSLTDYKIHCVNGKPLVVYVFTDRDEINHFDFSMRSFTPDWKEILPGQTPDDVRHNNPAEDKPELLDEMLEMASRLSAGEEYVRVDLYCTNGRVYFGEMTFSPDTYLNKCYKGFQENMRYLLNKIKEDRKAHGK